VLIDRLEGFQGALLKSWFTFPDFKASLDELRKHAKYPDDPEAITTIGDFDAPHYLDAGKDITAYLQVNFSFSYCWYSVCL